jgi:tetratricopeptide (TPR) repeat protein
MNWLKALGLVLVLWNVLPVPVLAAETALSAAETNSQETVRGFLRLQEQIHETQLAIEQNRKDAQVAAAENARLIANKLATIDTSLSAQRARELEAMQSSNQTLLIVAGTFAGLGLCAMLFMAFFQSRALNRLAEISAALPAIRPISPHQLDFGAGVGPVGVLGQAEQSNQRLLGALERLEQRIRQLERFEQSSLATSSQNGGGSDGSSGSVAQTTPTHSLLARGQECLESGRTDEALKFFEEVLQANPDNTEALVKKGAALEKMQKPDEAIECYDRAIEANGSLTIAYLYKAGLYNRLERFGDALACYEKALQTQDKRVVQA